MIGVSHEPNLSKAKFKDLLLDIILVGRTPFYLLPSTCVKPYVIPDIGRTGEGVEEEAGTAPRTDYHI